MKGACIRKHRMLLVDDNEHYSGILRDIYEKKGYRVESVVSAAEALNILQKRSISFYDTLISDVTMESRLAGLYMVWRVRKMGYKGTVILASTGFDVLGATSISRSFLGSLGVHYIVPQGLYIGGQSPLLCYKLETIASNTKMQRV